MTDLRTTYLGLELASPVVASASPLTGDVGALKAMESAGIGAVVLPSLFEEQIVHESLEIHRMLEVGADANPEAAGGYVPELDDYNTGAVRYLRHLEAAKRALSVPVIGSLNGVTRGGWTSYARMMEDAGADAVELNVYRIAAHPQMSGRQVERETIELVAAVRDAIDVPLAVKLGPAWSAFGSFARELTSVGADGLVLFNRFYQPDIDLETLQVGPHLELSTSDELALPLRWIALLYGRVPASLALTTGVHTATDVAKALLAGADVAMTTSALLRHGPDHVRSMLDGLTLWMIDREYASVEQMKGSVSQQHAADPAAFERANYMRTLTTYASTFRTTT